MGMKMQTLCSQKLHSSWGADFSFPVPSRYFDLCQKGGLILSTNEKLPNLSNQSAMAFQYLKTLEKQLEFESKLQNAVLNQIKYKGSNLPAASAIVELFRQLTYFVKSIQKKYNLVYITERKIQLVSFDIRCIWYTGSGYP